MTASKQHGVFAPNLAQQGVFLVVALVLCQFAFIGTLSWMLGEAEKEAQRQEHAREVTAKASRLLLVVYDTGDAVGKFAAMKQIGSTERFKAGAEEIPGMLKWLKDHLKGQPEPERLLQRIEKDIGICMPVIEGIRRDAEHLSRQEAVRIWRERRLPIQPVVDEMVADLEALMAYGRKIEETAPDNERAHRDATRVVLIAGLMANVMFFLLMVWFFTRMITRRLDVINDNVQLLRRGAPLNKALSGSDEITEVDRAFHETALAVRKEEALLKQSEARLRSIMETVPIGIVILNEIGTIELVNLAIEKAFGHEPHELLGKSLSRLLATRVSSGSKLMSDLAASSLGRVTELMAVRKDGKQFPVDFTLAKVDIEGQQKHIGMMLDATERVEIKKLRQSFVNMISEELRAPLTYVNAMFSDIRSGKFGEVSPKTTTGAGKAQQNIERLLLLINDLFDLERLESGKIEISRKRSSLAIIFDRSLNAVSSFAQKHHVSVEMPETEREAFVDPDRIVQVLVNLLSNAIKFSPPNSSVAVRVREVDEDGCLEIEVVDSGRGIPQEKLGSLFQKFSQVDDADAREKAGTGLGLVICKLIVEEHGGNIGVESEEGKGSRFWLRLPRQVAEAERDQ